MADPFTITVLIVSIVSSTTAFSAQTSALAQRLGRSDKEIQSQLKEIQVLCGVLEECDDIIRASGNVTIPSSIDRGMDVCVEQHRNLMTLVQRLRVDKLGSRPLLTKLKQLATESDLRAALSAFRDAVMLLRDLCSDLRLRQQLVQISVGLTQMTMESYESEVPMQASENQHSHVYVGHDKAPQTPTIVQQPQTTRQTQRSTMIGHNLQELIKQNFTRNATIVLDSSMGTFSEPARCIHVRAKMDTGCDHNLITMDLIEQTGIDRTRLKALSQGEGIEFYMVEGAKCIPLYTIDLDWYQDGDSQMRRNTTFYIVREGPFDMLIGSKKFAQDLESRRNPLLWVTSKTNERDRQRRKLEHQQHLRRQLSLENRERRAQAQIQGQAPQGQAPQGQAPQGQAPQGQAPQGQPPQGQIQGHP